MWESVDEALLILALFKQTAHSDPDTDRHQSSTLLLLVANWPTAAQPIKALIVVV
jgi:hypothetical protein